MSEVLLEVNHLSHEFILGKCNRIKVLDKISFHVNKGEVLGIVGESGCGKSTLARCIMNVYSSDTGSVIYQGIDTQSKNQYHINRKYLQSKRQFIFQDSNSSLNQRLTVFETIAEPLILHNKGNRKKHIRQKVMELLSYVGLEEDSLYKKVGELSGGMRQRVAIGRALSTEPELLIADEPIASLDVSIQAQIINLFKRLAKEKGCTIIFIAHDLSVVRHLCDRVMVMYGGKIVEIGPKEVIFSNPQHDYTKALLSSIPVPDPKKERERVIQDYEEKEIKSNLELQEVATEHMVLKECFYEHRN